MLMKKNSVFYGFLILFAAVIVALDQLTKWLTIKHIPLGGNGGSVLGLFDLTHHKNTGAAWSMLEGQTWLFVLVLVVFLALLVVCIWRRWVSKHFEWLCLAAIAGGGIGNAVDRVFRNGEVTDMIQFSFWKSFPTFNIADCFITVGCIALVIYVLFFDRENQPHSST
ncbi:MAG: signal peptidase II [Ruminococcaceae bacterium]|nr:signal peptidase II [Oscillospiraceae bacterium]